jgi:pilus assembly protein FimV
MAGAAVVLALLGILLMRRRRQEPEEEGLELQPATANDTFADVVLSEQQLELEDVADESVSSDEQYALGSVPDSRGYGEHKHDEYASDEASDALAEAEIYIAYGRYPQAIDLLKNALVNDPENVPYRLKLLELYQETGNSDDARRELEMLETTADSATIATAREALGETAESPDSVADSSGMGSLEQVERRESAEGFGNGDILDKSPVEQESKFTSAADEALLADLETPLESDFSGLEIEEPDQVKVDDELDLSADFDNANLVDGSLGEDLVIATETDGMSTKLDLARAYMDMGDEDGARQILEEVAAEGDDQIQAEARALLDRIA